MDAANQSAEDALAKLAEHFDSVLILCSRNEDGVTRATAKRAGNYYASKGLATEWLEDERNKETAEAIATKINPPSDE